MKTGITFNDVLESVDSLSYEEQETLMEIMHRRLIDHRRSILANEIQEADEEFRNGSVKPASPSEIIEEV